MTKVMKAKKVAVVAPYMLPLTKLVVDYIQNEGHEVVVWRALEIPDNLEVGRHDPSRLPGIVAEMDISGVDAIVLPLLSYNSDLGFTYGGVAGAYIYAPGHAPYQHGIALQAMERALGEHLTIPGASAAGREG